MGKQGEKQMKIRAKLLLLTAGSFFVAGLGTAFAETIVLDPADYIGTASMHNLPGQSFSVTNFGGIYGLNAEVSLVEFTNSQKVVEAGGAADGFFTRLYGTGTGSGTLAAVALKVDFTTTGDEVVQSVRVINDSTIDTHISVGLGSSQEGITCTGISTNASVIAGSGTTNVTVTGAADGSAYVLETAGGSLLNPIQSVDFRCFSDPRPSVNITHTWGIEVTTVQRTRTFVLDPEVYTGSATMDSLPGQSFSVTNFASIPGLIVDVSQVVSTNAQKVSASAASKGFFSRLYGTNDVPDGGSLAAVSLQFDFTAMDADVVDSVRVESFDQLTDFEAISLTTSQPGFTCTGTSTNGAVFSGIGTSAIEVVGDADDADYLIGTVGGSLTNPLETVTLRYSADPRPAANPTHQWLVTISTVSEYINIDPQDTIGQTTINNLSNQTFSVSNFVGITDLNMEVSLVEFTNSEKVMQSGATDGFFCRLYGTDAVSGDDPAAMTLRFDFSTDGAEAVESVRVQNLDNSGQYSLMSDELMNLSSSQAGITCAGTAYLGAVITGSGSASVTAQGDADGAGYVLETVGGSFANPIDVVDVRYFSDPRPAANVQHQWAVMIKTSAGTEALAILSLTWAAPGVLQMEINAASPAASHLFAKTDLTSGSWADAPHADNVNGPFQVTNLSCSVASGTNVLIYVETDEDAEFFSVNAQ
jgi:hypothetical protein